VAPPSNKNENYRYLAPVKGQSFLKKTLKRHQNRPINSDTKPIQSIPPRTNSAPASERDKNKHTNTIFSHLQRWTILCMVVELVVPILKGVNHFSIQFSFSAMGQNVDFRPVSKTAACASRNPAGNEHVLL